ncbi:50S ribosomal protein L21, related protein [Quillaja saponaria]|uniref:Large ribosomal subunit protein bL21m n=1 Tax=Quillaja saponaria TaxID=32244 RepID=A0AAD7QFU4_QUISA|nr:50S ribosomal protein L21, related protein [Quillaja saponaria]
MDALSLRYSTFFPHRSFQRRNPVSPFLHTRRGHALHRIFALLFIPSNLIFKLVLNQVLLLGSSSQTIVGRPMVPDASVHAVVEEHALDAKVIIFKKKRRKNYRRTKGHRQELTKLRITDIQGIEKSENAVAEKPSKADKRLEKVAVPS